MILSVTRKFIFVHVYRTGGTSIFRALAPEHDVRVALRTLPQDEWPALVKAAGLDPEILNFEIHTSASRMREVLGEESYGEFFKFAFVRNPWDHALSHYLFMMRTPDILGHADVRRYGGFREYIVDRFKPGTTASPQLSLISNSAGAVIVDAVGRYETLEADFAAICRRIGLGEVGLPVTNTTEHKPWPRYYDRESFGCVRDALRRDIEAFGYSDDPATYGVF